MTTARKRIHDAMARLSGEPAMTGRSPPARRTMEAATRRFPTNLESGLFVVPRPFL